MKTYNLKSVARRGSLLTAAFVIAGASLLPFTSASADALNPLTDRSLTLSSSAPGWDYTDGSGNTTYAQPNSASNGQKTGNTFSFKVSSDSTTREIHAMTFQYCTFPAGDCLAPGNNDYDTTGGAGSYVREPNGADQAALEHSDLEVVAPSATEVSAGNFAAIVNGTSGNVTAIPNADGTQGSFTVFWLDENDSTWKPSNGWTMGVSNVETSGTEGDGEATGKDNFITLTNSAGFGIPAGTSVKVVFFGTNANYITNPGADEFFVKINTYDHDTDRDPDVNLIDGGVTVANVMNRSIEIQTKVLETMDFSVGTIDPNTLDSTGGAGSQYGIATGKISHGVCDPIVKKLAPADKTNVLLLGNAIGEFSLETDKTYSTHSYWRLSSNSSAGATVYYSGVTLSNTVNDQIDAIGVNALAPAAGTEQFGLALDNGTGPLYEVSYAKERTPGYLYQNGADNAVTGVHATLASDHTTNGISAGYHTPRLDSLHPTDEYGGGTGNVNANYAGLGGSIDTEFAFDPNANLIPTAMATGEDVVDCVTGKVRYIANIAATTPAGIYTTKINYIAAPQY